MPYKKIIIKFSEFGIKYFSKYLKPIKEEIIQSDINMVFEVYVGKMFLFSTILSVMIFSYISILFTIIANFNITFSMLSGAILGLVSFFGILTIFHTYPFQKVNSKKKDIESNLPFAMNHMAAIASSGVPPSIMFKLLMDIEEYGEISKDAGKIMRNTDVFGMDIVSSIKDLATRTPSEKFKQFLTGIVSTIETGGDLKKYLESSAKEALFEYELKRERFLTTLSTYADFYTAVLIAAPLFFVSILSVMALIGGEIFGMDIPSAMQIGIYAIIPMLNTAFIAFIHYTQPTI